MPTKAILLAAGLGTRMRPLTDHTPKPLIAVDGVPLIDRILGWFSASGVNDIVVNSHYKAEMLESHLKRKNLPVIHISHEPDLLETGGGIKKALPLLGQAPFFSANSDTLCIDGKKPALHRLSEAWGNHMDALLLLHPTEKAVGYEGKGDFYLLPDGRLRRRTTEDHAPFVFTGVQLLHPRLFEAAPEGAFSMNLLYNRDISQDGSLQRIYGLPHDGSWLHVGDPKGLKLAEDWIKNH
jgi:MurNAc alpha-1-phosphate uridylyltransferase